jgi:hypothetical protein
MPIHGDEGTGKLFSGRSLAKEQYKIQCTRITFLSEILIFSIPFNPIEEKCSGIYKKPK